MVCIRRERVPVPCAERALRIARMASVIASLFSSARPTATVEGSASVPGRRRDSTAACLDSIPVSSISGVWRRARTAAPKQ